ncbi:GTP-binding protein gtr2 [Elsinoe australis]|uniref:GTP-binding protein gtr2 n=1 Tax=Elsinoe australis TaxID=40998 RepID=A0A2P7Z4C6_9PEZI|nr:GTP-binding protein gtr2 [Elsinoe australis]
MYLLGEAEYLQSDGFKRYVKQELDKQSMRIGKWYGQDFEMALLKTGPNSTLKEFCIHFMENNIPRQKQALADLKKLAPRLMQRTEKYISIKRARAKPKE